jgi:hypothetical protein
MNAGREPICSSAAQCKGHDQIYDVPDGLVALSFDDGPLPAAKPLYAFLRENKQKVTHFFIGAYPRPILLRLANISAEQAQTFSPTPHYSPRHSIQTETILRSTLGPIRTWPSNPTSSSSPNSAGPCRSSMTPPADVSPDIGALPLESRITVCARSPRFVFYFPPT